ncbi:leukocyte surface antigen CD47 isoform X5 [Anolis carolinensis]|uniref:leukocyte surface antigen CD47 isoform X5 n=1 Tax=Anolis carolinensis TaxID=28377 RepID=UPI002F2B429B
MGLALSPLWLALLYVRARVTLSLSLCVCVCGSRSPSFGSLIGPRRFVLSDERVGGKWGSRQGRRRKRRGGGWAFWRGPAKSAPHGRRSLASSSPAVHPLLLPPPPSICFFGRRERRGCARGLALSRSLLRLALPPSAALRDAFLLRSRHQQQPCSAQLYFEKVRSVTLDICNTSAIIPCRVTNLILHRTNAIFVKWKLQGSEFFSYDGVENKVTRNSTFQSANLLDLSLLPNGTASLILSREEAPPGNYTCDVAESSREGDTIVELIHISTSWFQPTENSFIIATVIVAAVLYFSQSVVVAMRFDMTLSKKIGLFLAELIVIFLAAIGVILLIPAGYESSQQIGLALIVVPAFILVPILHFLFTSVFEKQPLFAIILVFLKAIGYIIAVAGFGLCVLACPPKQGSIMIAGLAIIDIVAAIGLIYLIVIGVPLVK